MSSYAPTESKVWGATVGTGTGYIISQFILWFLGITLWGVSADALSAGEAVTAVPDPVNGLVGLGVTVTGAFVGGWWAKHTPRPADTYQPKRELIESPADTEGSASETEDTSVIPETFPVPEYAGNVQPI